MTKWQPIDDGARVEGLKILLWSDLWEMTHGWMPGSWLEGNKGWLTDECGLIKDGPQPTIDDLDSGDAASFPPTHYYIPPDPPSEEQDND